jgi:hypothetical protein
VDEQQHPLRGRWPDDVVDEAHWTPEILAWCARR